MLAKLTDFPSLIHVSSFYLPSTSPQFIIPHLKTVENFKTVVTSSVVGLLLSSLTQSVRDLKQAAMGVTAALIQLVEDNQEEDK